jgi:hypothetical protein
MPGFAADLDSGRADAVLPVLSLLLGLGEPGDAYAGAPAGSDSGIDTGSETHSDADDRTGGGDGAGRTRHDNDLARVFP